MQRHSIGLMAFIKKLLQNRLYLIWIIGLSAQIQPSSVMAKEPSEVYESARRFSVQVNSSVGSGSGVVVARQGDSYFVLTNSHVICSRQPGYRPEKCAPLPTISGTVQTFDGKTHQFEVIQRLQTNSTSPDLAILAFRASSNYPMATISDSRNLKPGSYVYLYGFPALNNQSGSARQAEFATGNVTSIRTGEFGAWNLRYSILTWGGQSGSPVLDSDGNLVAIHAGADEEFRRVVDRDNQPTGTFVSVKTGINLGVPINELSQRWDARKLPPLALASPSSVAAQASAANPNSPSTSSDFYSRGVILFADGKFSEAVEAFGNAIRLNPRDVAAYAYRGLSKHELKQYREAIADYNQSLAIDANHDFSIYSRGNSYYELGEYQKAIEDYRNSLRLKPDYGKAYIGICGASVAIRFDIDYQSVAKDCDQGVALDPDNDRAYVNRSALRIRLEQYQIALVDAEKAIELNSENALGWVNRAIAKRFLGNLQGALDDLSQALQLDPNLVNAYNTRGQIHAARGNTASALADYNRALQIDPKLDWTYVSRGQLRSNMGDYRAAIEDYDLALRINPRNFYAYGSRGNTRRLMGDYTGALADHNQAISMSPRTAILYYNRGVAWYHQKKYELAIADYNRTLELDRGYADAYRARGEAYRQLGNRDRAIADYEQALRLYRQQQNTRQVQSLESLLRSLR